MMTLTNTYSHFLQDYPNFFDKKNLDLFFQKVLVERNSHLSGYYDLPFAKNQAIFDYLAQKKEFLDSISNIVIVGIGGRDSVFERCKVDLVVEFEEWQKKKKELSLVIREKIAEKEKNVFLVINFDDAFSDLIQQ